MDALEIGEPGGQAELLHFDKVFSPRTSQEMVFDEVKPFIQIALDGENVCMFAYGQTGSGKTHTMEGNHKEKAHQGILPRCGDFIF